MIADIGSDIGIGSSSDCVGNELSTRTAAQCHPTHRGLCPLGFHKSSLSGRPAHGISVVDLFDTAYELLFG